MNRCIYMECNAKNCPAGAVCANQRFQRRAYMKCEPFRTEWKGWGLRALEPMQRGDFVTEYVGEVLDVRMCEERLKQYRVEGRPLYFHVLNEHKVIDGSLKGNVSRFINHSCEPNCSTKRWIVNGEERIGIFAIKLVEPGAELTFDYSWSPAQVGDAPCYCGVQSCTGYMGEKAFYDSSRQGNMHGLAPGKVKARVSQNRALKESIEAKDDNCFICREFGTLICCDVPRCPKVYHRTCLTCEQERP
jgi:hypothetical protein